MVRTRSSVQSRSLAPDPPGRCSRLFARVAQLVEHFTRNEEVASSILASGSKRIKAHFLVGFNSFQLYGESQLLGFRRGSNTGSRNYFDELARRSFVTDRAPGSLFSDLVLFLRTISIYLLMIPRKKDFRHAVLLSFVFIHLRAGVDLV
jgi:hypothetical protein